MGLPHISDASHPNGNNNYTVLNKPKTFSSTDTSEAPNGVTSLQTFEEINLRENPPYSSEIQQNSLLLKGNGCTACLYKNWSSHTLESINTILFCDADIIDITGHLAKLNCRFPCLMASKWICFFKHNG